MSSAEYHLSLLDSVVRSEERLCEGELCCLGHRMKVNTLFLLHKIYHRAYYFAGVSASFCCSSYF